MASNLRSKLQFFIRLAGFLVFFFGIFILASAITIRHLLTGKLMIHYGYGHNTCQYWAGIPTTLTGLFLMIARKNEQTWKYFSFCCVVVTMVLTLGVIITETTEGANVHMSLKDSSFCKRGSIEMLVGSSRRAWEHDCRRLQKALPWYFVLLFTTDIVLVLSFLVILLLVVDWILFVAPPELSSTTYPDESACKEKMAHHDEMTHEAPQLHQGRYVQIPLDSPTPNQITSNF